MARLYATAGEQVDVAARSYAAAEQRGDVSRASNVRGMSAEEYARRLIADGLKKGWISAGSVDPRLRRARVAASRRPLVLDGVATLTSVLKRAGYQSVIAAVAEFTVLLHPGTVAQTNGR